LTDLEGRIRVTHADDGARSRLAVFFRLIIMIPHFIWLAIWSIGAFLVAPVHWVIALIRGGPAHWAHGFYSAYVRYALHVYAYLYLAAGRYPGFIGERGYVIEADFPPPGEQRRWTIALRFFIALPALVLAGALTGGIGGNYSSSQGGDAETIGFQLGGLGTAMALLAWFASLALARTPTGLRDAQVYCQGYAAQAFGYLLLLTDRYPTSDPHAVPLDPMPAHPVRLSAGEDRTRNRLTVFFRIFLAIPHLIWITLWGIAVFFAAIAGWFAALATGRLPDALHRFLASFVRYGAHVSSYLYILGDPFPGFLGRAASYPVDVEIDEPQPQHRAKTGFRIILAFPAWLVASGFGAAAIVAAVGAWFSVLFTGRIPDGLHGLLAWAVRYEAQAYSYLLLLTDRYPYTGPDGRERPEAGPEQAEPPDRLGAAPERPLSGST
jgi:Domain of unknown function (DUF4389)